jgi:hypothetical protein
MTDPHPPRFLLFAVSNPPPGLSILPDIYPYAFIQLREVADRHGVDVQTLDVSRFFEDGSPRWAHRVRDLIQRYPPTMVGITIRQVDTLIDSDYTPGQPARYNPLLIARRLMALLRAETRAPIVLGGFGFTAMAAPLFRYLQPDFGILGEADGFFARFADVLARRGLASVPNLVFPEEGRLVQNERVFFPPADRPEYGPEQIDDLERFYGTKQLYAAAASGITVAVELARGCPYACTFCIEPAVKGTAVRHRDLEVVMQDVENLVRRGVRSLWFVCSEINIGHRNELALRVAERMIAIREAHGEQITWNAYFLPRALDSATSRTLDRSGFIRSLNDVVSLDPAAMKRARVPYSQAQAIAAIQERNAKREQFLPTEPRSWGIFFGHDSTSFTSLRVTFEKLEELHLLEYYDVLSSINATRVFDILEPDFEEPYISRILPSGEEIEREARNVFPSYYYNKEFCDALGGREASLAFFTFCRETILSTEPKRLFDARSFLADAITREDFLRLFTPACQVADTATVLSLFANQRTTSSRKIALGGALCDRLRSAPLSAASLDLIWPVPGAAPSFPADAARLASSSARQNARLPAFALLLGLFAGWRPVCEQTLEVLGLGPQAFDTLWSTTSFAVHRALYGRFPSNEALSVGLADALAPLEADPRRVAALFASFLLRFNSVDLQPVRRAVFVPLAASPA